MPREFYRTDRLSAQIHKELATMIRDQLRDPRVAGATVAEVRVTRDLSIAKIYISAFDQAMDLAETVTALNHAAPRLRSLLGRGLRMHSVPRLEFIEDHVAETGSKISNLINDALKADAVAAEPLDGDQENG